MKKKNVLFYFILFYFFVFKSFSINKTFSSNTPCQQSFNYSLVDMQHKKLNLTNHKTIRQQRGKKITTAQKKLIEFQFLDALKEKDFSKMQTLFQKYPFLKTNRFQHLPSLITIIFSFEKLPEEVFNKGWGALQIASYIKDLEMLNFFLKEGVPVRTLKTKGRQSIESNALHIAIKRNFYEGAKMIINHIKQNPEGKSRFIDEKNKEKMTPWILAIKKDLKEKDENLKWTRLIARERPSALVRSNIKPHQEGKTPFQLDALEFAHYTQNLEIIELAKTWLGQQDNYTKYKEIQRESPRRSFLKAP